MTGMQLIILKFVPKLEFSFMSGQLFISMVCVANVCTTALVRRKGFGFAIVGGICWCQIKQVPHFVKIIEHCRRLQSKSWHSRWVCVEWLEARLSARDCAFIEYT